MAKDNNFTKIPLGKIRPLGWLKNQLKIQAQGLTGNLDSIWPDVGENSGWLGGSGEKWERGPYYCDGLLPLAYLLEDEKLISKSQKWVEWCLKSQREDGFFGPPDNADWWPRMVMLKVLMQYYEATKDIRIISFMEKYFKYQAANIKKQPLTDWGKFRVSENILVILWLFDKRKDEKLLSLIETLIEQGFDWADFFNNFPYKGPTGDYMVWKEVSEARLPVSERTIVFPNYMKTHVVNVAMGIKMPALLYKVTGDEKYIGILKNGIEQLMKYHGVVNGMFTGDEHLNGRNPSQGTELCAVVEYMYTLENIIEILGDGSYADILEKVAYNAFPAMISPDFTSHQYLQQSNQVLCNVAPRNWYNNLDDSNIFGLEPNFGCCTANMHQGWPKLCQYMWMMSDDGLAAVVYGPSVVEAEIRGSSVTITEETNYPFENNITFEVKLASPCYFTLKFRIPGWCKDFSVELNGKTIECTFEYGFISITRDWENSDMIKLVFNMEIKISFLYNNSIGIERGPLVYGLKIEEEWRQIKGQEPFADYEVYPRSPWNYAIVLDQDNLEYTFKVTEGEKSEIHPFSTNGAPLTIKAKASVIKDWKMENNSAGELPLSPVKDNDEIKVVDLIPYGCTTLRISQFPWTTFSK